MAIKYDDEHPDLDFGETLGTFWGVEARSNLDDSYFSGESSYIQGVYTGYTYQCVEYSRRVLLVTRGVVFPNCGRASEIFAFEKATHVESGAEHNFVACKNGETTVKPEPGMIIIYPYVEGVLPWGHIAVITEVGEDWVGIAEQNQANKSWLGKPYGRTAKLLHDAATGAWTVQETLPDTHIRNALGWKYVEGVPPRKPLSGEGHQVEYAPLQVLPQFLTPRTRPDMTRYRLPNKPVDASASDIAARFSRDTKRKDYSAVPKPGECWPGPVQEWQSIYFANETMNVPSIPAANNTFQLLGRGLRATVAALSDDEVAKRYNIPAFFVPAARLQLQEFNHASLIGTVVTTFSHEKGWRALESRLDSQAPYAATVLGSDFADKHGHGESWHPCTTNNDINRAVTRISRLKHRVEQRHNAGVNTTLYILEVTAGLDLASAFTEEEQAVVRLAALDVDVMAGQWEQWREEKLKACAAGEAGEDERPVFEVRRIGLNDEALRIFNGDILVDGVKADFVLKKEQWQWLFRLLTEKRCALKNQAAFEKFEAFMAAAASTKSSVPVVFQPLWAHMCDQPVALVDASAWGRAEAAKGNAKIAGFAQVAPDASDFDANGRCTLPLYAPDIVKPIKKRFRPSNPAEDPDDEIFTGFAGLIVNGYSGFGAVLEARRRPGAAAGSPAPTVVDAQHYGIRAMYFGGGDLDADMETD